MSKQVYCDKCKNAIQSGGREIQDAFRKNKYDLCDECYGAFQRFIETRPEHPVQNV